MNLTLMPFLIIILLLIAASADSTHGLILASWQNGFYTGNSFSLVSPKTATTPAAPKS
jgi:hypothetical protein